MLGFDYVQQGQRKVREQDEWIWNRRLERFIPMAQSVYNADSTILRGTEHECFVSIEKAKGNDHNQ